MEQMVVSLFEILGEGRSGVAGGCSRLRSYRKLDQKYSVRTHQDTTYNGCPLQGSIL